MQQIVFWPLPPPSLQLHSFIFCILWVLPSPRTAGPEVAHICIISILYLFSFLYFGHYLSSLQSCPVVQSFQPIPSLNVPALQWGRGRIQFTQMRSLLLKFGFESQNFQDFLDVGLKLCESYIRHIHRYPVQRGNIGSRQAFLY